MLHHIRIFHRIPVRFISHPLQIDRNTPYQVLSIRKSLTAEARILNETPIEPSHKFHFLERQFFDARDAPITNCRCAMPELLLSKVFEDLIRLKKHAPPTIFSDPVKHFEKIEFLIFMLTLQKGKERFHR